MKIDPSTLKITDMRFAEIDGAPKRCTLVKLYTNQGIVGYGEVRDASSATYAAMLKSRGIIDPELDQFFAVGGRENIAPLSDTSDFSKNF